MSLTAWRRSHLTGAVVALALTSFLASLVPSRAADAAESDALAPISYGTGGTSDLSPAIPTGEAFESATVNMATGTARSMFRFELPSPRGAVLPSLSLSYDSSAGIGYAGHGWTLEVPSIARKGKSGIPRFTDPAVAPMGQAGLNPSMLGTDLGTDDYFVDGRLLIPIAVITGGSTVLGPATTLPPGIGPEGTFAYFRTDVDDGARYFLSQDGRSWFVQTKAGHILTFGGAAIETAETTTGQSLGNNLGTGIYKWHLANEIDASGNGVFYVWDPTAGGITQNMPTAHTLFLTDIYDTLQPGQPATNTAAFAHHVHLTWSLRAAPSNLATILPSIPYVTSPIWKAPPFAELQTVDVTSATSTSTQRRLVREYQLGYSFNVQQTLQFLTSITPVGDCLSVVGLAGIAENASGLIASGTTRACPTLPPTTYKYSGVFSIPEVVPPTVLAKTPNVLKTTSDFVASEPVIGLGFADVNADAVDDFTAVVPGSGAFTVELGPTFSGQATQQLAYNANTGPGSMAGAILGDWAANGTLNALVENTVGASAFWSIDQVSLAQAGAATWAGYPTSNPAESLPISADVENLVSLSEQFFSYQRAFDIDGDRLPDFAFQPSASGSGYDTWFSSRDRGGITHPFSVHAGVGANVTPPDYDPTNFLGGNASTAVRFIADIDGDGVSDLILLNKTDVAGGTSASNIITVKALPGLGDGRFGSPTTTSSYGRATTLVNTNFPVSSDVMQQCTVTQPLGLEPMQTCSPGAQVRVADLNGDGQADLAVLDSSGLTVCLKFGGPNLDSGTFNCSTDASLTSANLANIEIGDLDGSGINQVVWFPGRASGSATGILVSPNGSHGTGPHDGLLQTVSNGAGQTITFTYDTVRNQSLVLPIPAWVVTSVTTQNGLTGAQAFSSSTHYTYQGPVYDDRDRAFVGFQSVTADHAGAVGAPGQTTKTTYYNQSCQPLDSCQSGNQDYSLAHVMRGLPVLVESSDDTTGQRFETTFHQFTFQAPYASLDNRFGISPSKVTTSRYLWPESQTATPTFLSPIAAISGGSSAGETPSPISVTLPAVGTQLQSAQTFDVFGNETSSADFGVLASGTVTPDVPILSAVVWQAQDLSGWLFRATKKQTGYADSTGSVFASASTVRELDYAYDSDGRVTDVSGVLANELPLPGPGGAARAAGQPPDASQNGTVHLRHITYDAFGNVQSITNALSPNETPRCFALVRDALFAQLVSTVTSYPAGCGVGTGMSTSTQFDRGLDRETSRIDAAGRVTTKAYDDFGRLIQVARPSSTALGVTVITEALDYQDAGPVRRVHSAIAQGSEVAPTFVDHFRYYDGLGTLLLALDQGNGGLPWIGSAMTSRYPNGKVAAASTRFMIPANGFGGASGPAGVTPGTLPISFFGGPDASFTYDALGRTLTSTNYVGSASTQTYHTAAMSVDQRDPEESSVNSQATHTGSLTSSTFDGHGRVVRNDRHLAAVAQGAGDVVTTTNYLATGEISSTVQTSPQGVATRVATYDTFGRATQTTEPNSGVVTYAYNDVNELVGISDARGCGLNYYHDGFGRIIAEDYSPCTTSQAAYTRPNIATGAGAEAFFVYDSPPGMLAETFDRGEHSIFGYDARGRQTSIKRQFALPTTIGTASGSISGPAVSGTLVDAQDNPIAGATVTLSGSSSRSATTDANGHYAFSGLASGGSYSVNPANITNCAFSPTSVANLNKLTTSQIMNFMGIGSACGGAPFSTPIPPMGSIVISGAVTSADGNGIPGLAMTLGGSFQATTHTDPGGFYSFSGLASGTYSVQASALPSGCTVAPIAVNNIHATATESFTAAGTCGAEGEAGASAVFEGAQYAPHVYQKTISYDAADRLISETSGADVPQLILNGSQINVSYYEQGGIAALGSSYGPILRSQLFDATGSVTAQTYGDAASTSSTLLRDGNERLVAQVVTRPPPPKGGWATYTQGAPPAGTLTFQSVLASDVVSYDFVGNPLSVTQRTTASTVQGTVVPAVIPSEWPAGIMPTGLSSYAYYDDYRLKTAATAYLTSSANDTFVAPYTAAEISSSAYPPLSPVSTGNRVRSVQYAYDWRGNETSSSDDASVFYDRSLGVVTNGGAPSAFGPDQPASAAQGANTLAAKYDATGNLTSLTNSATSTSYTYTWDEVGRLATATRAEGGKSALQATFAYDATGERVRSTRQIFATSGTTTDHTLWAFPSLVLEHAAFPGAIPGEYERDAKTENVYLRAGGQTFAHVFYDEQALPQASGTNGKVHVFLTVADRLGSTSSVIDQGTGELVERGTYLALAESKRTTVRRAGAASEKTSVSPATGTTRNWVWCILRSVIIPRA